MNKAIPRLNAVQFRGNIRESQRVQIIQSQGVLQKANCMNIKS